MPKLGKCHSAQMAKEFIRLGWTLRHECYANGDDEPYEYLFEWFAAGEPVYPVIPPPVRPALRRPMRTILFSLLTKLRIKDIRKFKLGQKARN